MATTGAVRNMNRNRIRQYARQYAEVRIAEAARETGLSIPTVSRMVADLVETGELFEAGACASTGGRRACTYRVNPMYLTYLLVRVEANNLTWQLRDFSGGRVESGEELVQTSMVAELDRLLSDIQSRYPMLRATYLGVAAMISGGVIARMNRKHEMQGLNVSEHFAQIVPTPVFVENDMNLVASGRWSRLGLSKGSIVCLYVNELGTGAGLVIDGRVWRGKHGLPGEMSFIPAMRRPSASDDPDYVEYLSSIVCMYAAVVDPDRIVFYANRVCDMSRTDRILERCKQRMPEEFIPVLEFSEDWDSDYLLGMDNETRSKLGIL